MSRGAAPCIQLCASVGKWLALAADPCADLAPARTAVKVGGRLGVGQLPGNALHAHLPLQPLPVDVESGGGVGGKVAALPRVIVCEEDEAALVVALG
eukprot:364429-Chlamydomonas_euryale.AAC.25